MFVANCKFVPSTVVVYALLLRTPLPWAVWMRVTLMLAIVYFVWTKCLLVFLFVRVYLTYLINPLALPAMGHSGTCPPSTSNCFIIFFWLFRELCHCLLHEMNFIIFLCVTLKLFSFTFVPVLPPNPGDATVWIQRIVLLHPDHVHQVTHAWQYWMIYSIQSGIGVVVKITGGCLEQSYCCKGWYNARLQVYKKGKR